MKIAPYTPLLCLLLALFGCHSPKLSVSDLESGSVGQGGERVIFGSDDRREVYLHANDAYGQIARSAAAVLVNQSNIYVGNQGGVSLYGASLGYQQSLCSDERFVTQPTPGFCSATLIDENLVLTAGHCIDQSRCGTTKFVFNFYYDSPGQLAAMDSNDVYGCSEVVVRKLGYVGAKNLDYAIVRLDRAVLGRTPAQVEKNVSGVASGEGVVVIGFPSGLPAKIENGGTVQSTRSQTKDYFKATTDTFGGNSGSGVYNAAGVLVGILVRGANDYAYDASAGCYRAEQYGATAPASEDSTYAFNALTELCDELAWDGAICHTELPATTSEPGLPASWSCNPAYYGTSDGCDCACGAYDPDCDSGNQQLYNCSEGESCNEEGLCVSPPPQLPEEPSSEGWTCNVDYYGTADGCDCNCGVPDPDCDITGQQLYGCMAGETCSDAGACVAEEPVSAWACDPSYYDASDGCDCACGEVDPDCNKPNQLLYGCSTGQSCSDSGLCQ